MSKKSSNLKVTTDFLVKKKIENKPKQQPQTKSWVEFETMFSDIDKKKQELEKQKEKEKSENDYLMNIAIEEFPSFEKSVENLIENNEHQTKKPQIKELKLNKKIGSKKGKKKAKEIMNYRKTNDDIEEITSQEFELIKKKQLEKWKKDDDEIESDSDDWSKKSLLNMDNAKKEEKRDDDDIDITPFATQSEDGNLGVKEWIENKSSSRKTWVSSEKEIEEQKGMEEYDIPNAQKMGGDEKSQKQPKVNEKNNDEMELEEWIETSVQQRKSEEKKVINENQIITINSSNETQKSSKPPMEEKHLTTPKHSDFTTQIELPEDTRTISLVPSVTVEINNKSDEHPMFAQKTEEEVEDETKEKKKEVTVMEFDENNTTLIENMEEESDIGKEENTNEFTFGLPKSIDNLNLIIVSLIYKFTYCGAPYKVYGCYDTSYHVFIIITKLVIEVFPSTTSFKTTDKFSEKLPILINKQRQKHTTEQHTIPQHVIDIINEHKKEVIREIKHCKNAKKLI